MLNSSNNSPHSHHTHHTHHAHHIHHNKGDDVLHYVKKHQKEILTGKLNKKLDVLLSNKTHNY